MNTLLTTVGLSADLIGAVLLTWGLWLKSDREILESTVMSLGDETIEGNRSRPIAVALLQERWRARVGGVFMILGFLLQLVAALSQP